MKIFILLIIAVLMSPFSASALESVKSIVIDDINTYFFQVETLKKENRWQDIILLGEKAAAQCFQSEQKEKEFIILDQLVSTYYRLGNYVKAQEKADRLITLGQTLASHALIINSFYKLSAVLRGQANEELDKSKQRTLFMQARSLVNESLKLCDDHCPQNKSLRAKVLFNAGAAECDNPEGDFGTGIVFYKEAVVIFSEINEEDYKQRTLIRLGKAYLLQDEIDSSWTVIAALKGAALEERTLMHLYYLETQVLQREQRWQEAFNRASDGKEIAIRLQARTDIFRFEQCIDALVQKLYHCQGV